MMGRSVKCIFFDWDGCLADTLGLWTAEYRQALARRGIEADQAEICRELFTRWAGPSCFGVEDGDAFSEEIRRGLEAVAGRTELNEGAADTLKKLKSLGLTVGILTTSRRNFVQPVLHRHRLDRIVDILLTIEDVGNYKPHPEIVEKALSVLSVARDEALLVGDSSVDIEAGRGAGVATVLYFPEHNKPFYRLDPPADSQPDFVIRGFPELFEIVNGS